jgi:hypothetical protein
MIWPNINLAGKKGGDSLRQKDGLNVRLTRC